MIAHAVLRVRGPALRIIIEGHPTLYHDGQGESVWTVAMDEESYADFIVGLQNNGVDFDALRLAKPTQQTGRHDACQFCAYFDPLTDNQCGATDWDFDSRRLVAATQDGQSSLDRCPEGHTVQ